MNDPSDCPLSPEYCSAMDALPIGVIVTDLCGDLVFASQHFLRMSGLSLGQTQAKGWMKSVYADDRQRIFRLWYHFLAESEAFTCEFRIQSDNSTTWVLATAGHLQHGLVNGFVITIADISFMKSSEDSFIATPGLVPANDAMLIWTFDVDDGVVRLAPEWFEATGWEAVNGGLLLNDYTTLIHPEDLTKMLLARERHAKGATSRYEGNFRVIRKGGGWIWFRAVGRIHKFDQNGEPSKMSGFHQILVAQEELSPL